MMARFERPEEGAQPAQRPCILIVEDEIIVRMALGEDLRFLGHEVIEASNADEALALLRSGVAVDLVISDVQMPGSLDGIGLLRVVRDDFPALPVIITSGHLPADNAVASGAANFLPKPYTPNNLNGAVEEQLARRR